MSRLNRKWIRISIFYAIAILFSLYFRVYPPQWYEQLNLPCGLDIYKSWLGGLGPFLGALVVSRLFRTPRRTTPFGTSKKNSLIMALIPILLFTLFGADSNENLNPQYYGFNIGFLLVVYCLLEETGWRGYLQDELRGMNFLIAYSIIGVMWYTWHLTFLRGPVHLVNDLIILAILILASWGIGLAVRYTRSLLVAACLHMIGNIVAFSSLVQKSVSADSRLLIAAISIAAWMVILVFWDKIARLMQKQKS